MMGNRQKLDGDGWDLTTKWRKVLVRMQRAGVTHAIKKRLSRQRRRESRGAEDGRYE